MFGDVFVQVIADWLVIAVVVVGAAAGIKVPRAHMYQAFVRAMLTGLTALWFAKIISLLYQGERPFVELGVAPKAAYLNNPGFPSDHALLVFTVTLVVWATTKNRIIGATLLICSILVAVGRVAALVHTPLDVMGGALCALAAASVVYGRFLFTKNAASR